MSSNPSAEMMCLTQEFEAAVSARRGAEEARWRAEVAHARGDRGIPDAERLEECNRESWFRLMEKRIREFESNITL